MILEHYIKENRIVFTKKVKYISSLLNINPNWLMLVMWNESRLNHKIVNPNGGATGLIQFMPATARALGTSTEALKNMDNVRQLNYVYSYFIPYAGKIKSYSDLYLVTFFPVALNKPGNFVFQTNKLSASLIAKQNKIFDLNQDQKITKAEFEKAIYKRVPQSLINEITTDNTNDFISMFSGFYLAYLLNK